MKIKDPITTKKASEILNMKHDAVRKMVQRSVLASEKVGSLNVVSRRAVRRLKAKREKKAAAKDS